MSSILLSNFISAKAVPYLNDGKINFISESFMKEAKSNRLELIQNN
jgi:hypothetical protein